jgi:hypothetical protein
MLVYRKHDQISWMVLEEAEGGLDRILTRCDYLDYVDAELSDCTLGAPLRDETPSLERTAYSWKVAPVGVAFLGNMQHVQRRPGDQRDFQRVSERDVAGLGEIRGMKNDLYSFRRIGQAHKNTPPTLAIASATRPLDSFEPHFPRVPHHAGLHGLPINTRVLHGSSPILRAVRCERAPEPRLLRFPFASHTLLRFVLALLNAVRGAACAECGLLRIWVRCVGTAAQGKYVFTRTSLL